MTPKRVPWGAPPHSWSQLDCDPPILTDCCRAVRKAAIQRSKSAGVPISAIVSNFKQNWQAKLHDLNKYPIMRTYALYKFDFECETYLNAVRDRRYRNAISKFRLSSHSLEIERGRLCNPKVPVSERLCFRCNCIEDEQHFLVSCKLYEDLRVDLYDKVSKIITDFYEIGDREKFVRLMNSRDNNVLTWLGKFLYTAQRVRGGHHT